MTPMVDGACSGAKASQAFGGFVNLSAGGLNRFVVDDCAGASGRTRQQEA